MLSIDTGRQTSTCKLATSNVLRTAVLPWFCSANKHLPSDLSQHNGARRARALFGLMVHISWDSTLETLDGSLVHVCELLRGGVTCSLPQEASTDPESIEASKPMTFGFWHAALDLTRHGQLALPERSLGAKLVKMQFLFERRTRADGVAYFSNLCVLAKYIPSACDSMLCTKGWEGGMRAYRAAVLVLVRILQICNYTKPTCCRVR